MEYAKRYEDVLRKKYLRQVIVMKVYIKNRYPDKTEEDIYRMVCRIGRYHYKKRPKLTVQAIRVQTRKENPLSVLKLRLARGEISTDEYTKLAGIIQPRGAYLEL